jgi:hypothetical protein
MRSSFLTLTAVLVLLLPCSAMGGEPDSSAPPDSTFSLSLEDLYLRLASGGTVSPTAFTEPSTTPGTGTMHTIDEIMAAAPQPDNTNGVLPSEVPAGKTFWSLRTDGTWGPQTGTFDRNGDSDGDGVANGCDRCPNSPRIGDLCWSPGPRGNTCIVLTRSTDDDGDGCYNGREGTVTTGCDGSTPLCR